MFCCMVLTARRILQEAFEKVITEKDESLSELKSELKELNVTRADEKVMHYFCSQDIPF